MKKNLDFKAMSKSSGFTLIEVMIVIAIFSIGILGTMSMQTSAINLNAGTRKSTLAMEYANDTMERLMQVGRSLEDKFNVDDNDDGNVDESAESELNNDGEDNDGDGSVDEADELEWHRLSEFQDDGTEKSRGGNIPTDAYYDSIFDLSWTVTDLDCDGDGDDDAKQIDITVEWEDGSITLNNIRTNTI